MKQLAIALAMIFSSLFVQNAHADDWGCQVLLCLANPKGPTAVSECVPPIERLWASLHKLHPDPFPKCTMSNGSSSSANVAQQTINYYPLCPAGLTPLPAGIYIDYNGSYVKGFGDGSGMSPLTGGDDQQPLPQMACVGQLIGSTTQTIGYESASNNDSGSQPIITVNQYSDIQFVNPSSIGSAVDVYISGQLVNRVQY